MRWMTCFSTILLVLALALGPARAGEWRGRGFSADMIVVDPDSPGQEMTGKFYMDTFGIRMEQTHQGESGVHIVSFPKNTMFLVMPAEKAYMEMPYKPEAGEVGSLSDLYGSGPCMDFEIGKRLGRESLGGRKVVKWRCEGATGGAITGSIGGSIGGTTGGAGPNVYRWYDGRLGVIVREDGDDGSRMELRNIKEGRQAAALFAPPAGYEKMAMPMLPAMMRRTRGKGSKAGTGTAQPPAPSVAPGAAPPAMAMPDLEKLRQSGMSDEQIKEMQDALQNMMQQLKKAQ